MQSEGLKKAERYSSGGVVVGVIGIVAVVAVLAGGTIDSRGDLPAWSYPLGVLVAVAIWAVMLRPAVVLKDDEVEVRNVFQSIWIPYGQIRETVIKQVTTIHTGEKKYVGSGFGRTRRAIHRDGRAGVGEPSLGQLIEDKIDRRAKAAREVMTEAPAIRRTWAWPEISGLAAAGLVTLVLVLVG